MSDVAVADRVNVGTTLGNAGQREKEALAIRLYGSAPIRAEVEALKALYRRDFIAGHPSAAATLDAAAESLAMAACGYAANEDPDRPVIYWNTTCEHRWMDLVVPQSFYAIDDPDNVYRSGSVDGQARYEVRGKVNHPAPAQFTFMLYSAIPGVTQTMNASGHMVELAAIQNTGMQIEADGSFVVTIDSSPADGRPNHLQGDPDNRHMQFLVRDTFSDWATQNPVTLEIERVAGPPVRPVVPEAELAKRAAGYLRSMGPYWRNWYYMRVYSIPVNEVGVPWARLSGWGFNALANFSLHEDEALVVTLDSMGSSYMGIQVCDLWGIEFESRHQQASLTQIQAKANADGTYTYVIAPRDPGVHNWLDTDGHTAGTFTIRWQGAPPEVKSAVEAVKDVRLVKAAELKSVLPAGTPTVTPAERAEAMKARAAAFARRYN